MRDFFKNREVEIEIVCFAFTLFLVLYIHWNVYPIILKNGYTFDDWVLLFQYKTFGPSPLLRFFDVWRYYGPYTTVQFYYIALLYKLFGLNYFAYSVVNLAIKIFSTISVYPFTKIVLKDRLLAVVVTILFAASHGSSGALQYVHKGTEYLAISFILFFFISLYKHFTKENNKTKWLLISSVLFFISFMLSPIRVFPLLALVPCIEVIKVIRDRKIQAKNIMKRIFVIYFPIFLISRMVAQGTSGFLTGPFRILKMIINGDFEIIKMPFKGLSYIILSDDYWVWVQKNISSLLTPSVVGFLIVGLSAIVMIQYVNKNKNTSYIVESFSIIFSSFFIFFTWLILADALNFLGSIHWYLVIPSLGASFLLGNIIVSVYRKFNSKKYYFVGIIFLLLASGFVVSMGKKDILDHYRGLFEIGVGAYDQDYMQNKFMNEIHPEKMKMLIYLDISEDPSNAKYYEVTFAAYIEYWMRFKREGSMNGCIGKIVSMDVLEQSLVEDRTGFYAYAHCVENDYGVSEKRTFFNLNDFYAYKVINKDFVDIKQNIVRDLEMKQMNND